MNIKLHRKINAAKKSLKNKWFELMKPLATYLYSREDKIYQKKLNKITKEKAIKWIAEDIVKYMVKYNDDIYLVVADYINEDDLSGHDCMRNISFRYMLKRKKTKRAFSKFNWSIELQEEFIKEIKKINGIKVTDVTVKFTWERLNNHKATYKIEII